MRQKEALDGAIENNNPYLIVGFKRRDDLVQLGTQWTIESVVDAP